MAEFAELGMTAVDKLTEKHGDNAYDRLQKHNPLSSRYNQAPQSKQDTSSQQGDFEDRQSNRSGRRSGERPHHRHTTELPSPERERNDYSYPPPPVVNDREFDRQSETSERVLRSYENERDDPRRRPNTVRDRYGRNMSYGYDDRRPSSQGRPRSRYDDDGSDYDDRTGQRYRTSGRGYDDRNDRDYDREIIETEVYRGPPRDWNAQRSASYQGDNPEYAVTQYRGNGDLAPYDGKQRSRSRGRRDKDRDDYSDRSRSRDREHDGIRGKLENAFDTKTPTGVGAGLLGAVVGGLAGRQFGDKRHSKRDMVIGAVVGGLAVNAAENKWRNWKEDRDEEKLGGNRYDDRYDDRDYRSRSALR